jgi:hypothetical protein
MHSAPTARAHGQSLDRCIEPRTISRPGLEDTDPHHGTHERQERGPVRMRYVRIYLKPLFAGPLIQALRQIFLQNYWIDERDRLQWCNPEDGGQLPPPWRLPPRTT